LANPFQSGTNAELNKQLAFTGLSITAAMACSLVLDHFALVAFQHTAFPARIGCCCLIIAGLWIVTQT
jgi:uncharacterized membrane protein YdcZ (DUF606 family)